MSTTNTNISPFTTEWFSQESHRSWQSTTAPHHTSVRRGHHTLHNSAKHTKLFNALSATTLNLKLNNKLTQRMKTNSLRAQNSNNQEATEVRS